MITPEVNLKDSQPVHIYHATSRTTGKSSPCLKAKCNENDRTLAEVILEQPLFLAFGDKLILRSGDAKVLIGGAKVLEIHSPKRYKRTEARLAFLAKLNQAQTATQRIGLTLQKSRFQLKR